MRGPKKVRLDELLVCKGLASSRSQAKAIILAGKVRNNSELLDKPGRMLDQDAVIYVQSPPRFVSRGGDKLEGFLEVFPVEIESRDVLDVGASTGGFTDCCLQRGARSVTCIDVGRAQLHHRLLQDARVTNFEKINARYVEASQLPLKTYDLVVMDLSFISLTKVLPNIWNLLAAGGQLIALVKPQFEAEKKEVDAGNGIIKNPEIHQRVLNAIRAFALSELLGAHIIGSIESPIKGTSGNLEYLLGLKKMPEGSSEFNSCMRSQA
jgi:23S rRNA (cytidine1920-2'-O)/16S rRNA (cytidine1409-2'-O)-methyltransferase